VKVSCSHCEKSFDVPNAVVLPVAGKVVEKRVARELAAIESAGLRKWISDQSMSIRGFARMIGVSSKTVDNWLRVDRLTDVARKAIEAGLMKRVLK